MKVLSIFGTRPEAIKMAPVVKALEHAPTIQSTVAVTGQHREMLDQVLTLFSITPDYDLDVMRPGQSLANITSSVLEGLDAALYTEQPDLVLVHGDTTTTLAASLAAYYHQIPVGHIEAGLRTGNLYSPWPEEVNRKVASAIARLHFAPTDIAAHNLLQEGVPENHVFITGNTVVDALLETAAKLEADRQLRQELSNRFQLDDTRRLVLVTGHRRESFGQGFDSICRALRRLAARTDVQIIYPVHLNPNVKLPVENALGALSNVSLIEPQDYLPFIFLMMEADLILTDSGGVQEEAPSLGKPVLVMREKTERPEAVAAGTVKLVGTDEAAIYNSVVDFLDSNSSINQSPADVNPYGDGLAAPRILSHIINFLEWSPGHE